MKCGTGAYVRLMEQYPLVTDAFLRLSVPYQKAGSSSMHTLLSVTALLPCTARCR